MGSGTTTPSKRNLSAGSREPSPIREDHPRQYFGSYETLPTRQANAREALPVEPIVFNDQDEILQPGSFPASNRRFYHTLPANNIRLLDIGDVDETWSPRNGFLKTSLPTSLPYCAVSYCWTDQRADQEIESGELSGFRITTDNKALLDILKAKGFRYIWIDAVCINQRDFTERQQQVSAMRSIYACAEIVVVWLGNRPNYHYWDPREKIWSQESYAVDSLLSQGSRTWWRRVWVYQEIAVAKQIQVVYGRQDIDWNAFIGIFRRELAKEDSLLKSQPSDQNRHCDLQVAYQSITAIRNLRARTGNSPSALPLRELLQTTSTSYSSLKCDKIFALLGLIGPRGPKIEPDYTQPVALVFLSALIQIIDTEKTLDILVDGWPPLVSEGFSWLPDFSNVDEKCSTLPSFGPYRAGRGHQAYVDLRNARDRTRSLFHGSRIPQPEWLRHSVGEDPSLRLVIRGTCVDEIAHVTTLDALLLECPSASSGLDETQSDATTSVDTNAATPVATALPHSEVSSPPATNNNFLKSNIVALDNAFAARSDLRQETASGNNADNKTETYSPTAFTQLSHQSIEEYKSKLSLNVNHAVFITAHGIIGFGPTSIRRQDQVVVVCGSRVPFILRPSPSDSEYSLVGDALVDGLMKGEVDGLLKTYPRYPAFVEFILR